MLNTNLSNIILPQGNIIYKEEESTKKLFEMNLTPETLIRAAVNGLKSKLMQSRYTPPLYIGMSQWSDTIVGLRKQLCKSGWGQCDKYNLNRTVSPNNDFAVVVSSGDAGVGKDYSPTTLNKKGELSLTVIEGNNNIQLSLFPIESLKKKKKYNIESILHWFLLYYTDGRNIWVELSLPRELNKDGRISSWFQRIILPPVEISSIFSGDYDIPDNETENEIVAEDVIEENDDDFDIPIDKKY